MQVLIKTPDGSFIRDRKVLYFSYERFVRDIVQGNRCFICGANPELVPFNDEHVIPDWILRRYNLHGRVITLPNQTTFRYGQFKMPCCQDCNSELGAKVETPMSRMFGNGFTAFTEQFLSDGPYKLFCWMALIFLKTHLKDAGLAMHQDSRKGTQKLGELHSWSDLHHVHCIARSSHTNCNFRKEAMGSILVFPAKTLPYRESFDYCDLSFAQTLLVRIDEIAVIAVFDDSCACVNVIQDFIQKIKGPLSPLQLREIATHMAAINIHLSERPKFGSGFDSLSGEYGIGAEVPREVKLVEWDSEILGQMMHHICGSAMPEYDGKAQVLDNIKTGQHTFLYNDQGEFAANHMDLIDADESK
jgi:hypothetical protein